LDAARADLEDGRQQLAEERTDYEEGVTEVEDGQTLLDLGDRLLATTNDYSVVSDDDSAAIATVQFTDQSMDVDTQVREAVVNTLTNSSIDGVEVLPSQEIS